MSNVCEHLGQFRYEYNYDSNGVWSEFVFCEDCGALVSIRNLAEDDE